MMLLVVRDMVYYQIESVTANPVPETLAIES